MTRIIILIGILAILLGGTLSAQVSGEADQSVGSTQDTSASAEGGKASGCSPLTIGASDKEEEETEETVEYIEEPYLEPPPMYEEPAAGEPSEEEYCEYDENGELICYEGEKIIRGCQELEGGKVECPE